MASGGRLLDLAASVGECRPRVCPAMAACLLRQNVLCSLPSGLDRTGVCGMISRILSRLGFVSILSLQMSSGTLRLWGGPIAA